jgi:outer membrane biogenesis lipoprotein LolB
MRVATKLSGMAHYIVFAGVLMLLLGLLNGCARLIAPPEDQPEARSTIEALSMRNAGLAQFKGLMQLSLQANNRTLSGRAAWAAKSPDHLRVEWLSMMGQPVASLAGDGQTITFRSYADSKIHRLKQSPTALDQLINIPIGVEDLITLLSGRPLIPAYTAAREKPDQGAGMGGILLQNRWHAVLTFVRLDSSGELQAQEVYDKDGALRYGIQWLAWQDYGQYRLPKKVQVETASGERLDLTTERYWTDVQLPSSAFALQGASGDQPEP